MRHRRLLALVGATLLAATGQAVAADMAPPPESSDWVFTGAAYLWGSGIEGDVGAFGLEPQDIDISFSDVLSNLDMAFMGLGEVRNGPFSIGMDVAYAKLGATVDTPFGILADDIDVTVTTLMATGILGYALIDTGSAHLDVIAGARLWSVDNDFGVNSGGVEIASFSDGGTWVDPLVGAKFRADLGSDFYVSGWGMIGGFGVSSDLMWDAMAGIGYEFTDSFSVFGGYRAVSVDYSDDGFVYDVVQQGPIFAGVFRF
jgi:hypothetical protein